MDFQIISLPVLLHHQFSTQPFCLCGEKSELVKEDTI
jgi:hypothetical protein